MFYDFECFQAKLLVEDTRPKKKNKKQCDSSIKKEHEVNLCVAQQTCDKCRDNDENDIICEFCGDRMHIFWGENIVDNFMNYLGGVNDKFTRIIITAHNAQSYDAHFILRNIYANSGSWKLNEDSLIIKGTKIIKIRVGRYSFIDSLNFFNVPLAKLPKLFLTAKDITPMLLVHQRI